LDIVSENKGTAISTNISVCEEGFWSGAIVWVILVSINSTQGTINAHWTQGASTIIASLLAFVVYGITVTYTIKNYGELGVKA